MPLKMYCAGLLLPGERKSVEPMAARLAPDNVRRMHQSLHHVVADAPWSDEAVLAEVRSYALTAMRQKGPLQAWIVDDTGFPKKGTRSVGVVRHQELKQELGLGHFEGRGWRGFHHHATLCIAAYGFLVAERSRFSPSARAGKLQLCAPKLPLHFKPRGSPSPGRAA